jgi:hypothetical protein
LDRVGHVAVGLGEVRASGFADHPNHNRVVAVCILLFVLLQQVGDGDPGVEDSLQRACIVQDVGDAASVGLKAQEVLRHVIAQCVPEEFLPHEQRLRWHQPTADHRACSVGKWVMAKKRKENNDDEMMKMSKDF